MTTQRCQKQYLLVLYDAKQQHKKLESICQRWSSFGANRTIASGFHVWQSSCVGWIITIIKRYTRSITSKQNVYRACLQDPVQHFVSALKKHIPERLLECPLRIFYMCLKELQQRLLTIFNMSIISVGFYIASCVCQQHAHSSRTLRGSSVYTDHVLWETVGRPLTIQNMGMFLKDLVDNTLFHVSSEDRCMNLRLELNLFHIMLFVMIH